MLRPSSFLYLLLISVLIFTGSCEKDPDEEPDPEPELEYVTNQYCDNSCYFSDDGECDDGGYDSKSDFCKFGTDCDDCGVRIRKRIKRR